MQQDVVYVSDFSSLEEEDFLECLGEGYQTFQDYEARALVSARVVAIVRIG